MASHAQCAVPLPSVGERREDEEPVFLSPDPAHQLMDGTDGGSLGPQGAVAHVELKGTCHLEEGQGSLARAGTPRAIFPGSL